MQFLRFYARLAAFANFTSSDVISSSLYLAFSYASCKGLSAIFSQHSFAVKYSRAFKGEFPTMVLFPLVTLLRYAFRTFSRLSRNAKSLPTLFFPRSISQLSRMSRT